MAHRGHSGRLHVQREVIHANQVCLIPSTGQSWGLSERPTLGVHRQISPGKTLLAASLPISATHNHRPSPRNRPLLLRQHRSTQT